jgi:hypothetical protein
LNSGGKIVLWNPPNFMIEAKSFENLFDFIDVKKAYFIDIIEALFVKIQKIF